MSEEQMTAICSYIKSHAPRENDIETITAALRGLGLDCEACTKEGLVNPDDAWLISDQDKKELAGIKGKGWAQSLMPKEIEQLKSAVAYSKEHASELKDNTFVNNEYTNMQEYDNKYINEYDDQVNRLR